MVTNHFTQFANATRFKSFNLKKESLVDVSRTFSRYTLKLSAKNSAFLALNLTIYRGSKHFVVKPTYIFYLGIRNFSNAGTFEDEC